MNRPEDELQARLSGLQRVALSALACGLLALLMTATLIEPDPRGFGTHQRLGLPPCTVLAMTGVRCPSCGMTTAWSCLVRGQVVGAGQANWGGALLGVICGVLAPWALVSGLRGRWLIRRPNERVVLGLVVFVLIVTLLDWSFRLWMENG